MGDKTKYECKCGYTFSSTQDAGMIRCPYCGNDRVKKYRADEASRLLKESTIFDREE
ncbi:MAG: hypothetical protein ACOCWQ_06010 [Nanoarchaeota archaeon]